MTGTGNRDEKGGQRPKPKGQQQKGQENAGWDAQQNGQNDGWQSVGGQQRKFGGQQRKFGGQQQKSEGTQGWGCKKVTQPTKTMDKPKTQSSSSSTSTSSGWQTVGVQQQRTQGTQGWDCKKVPQPARTMDTPRTSRSPQSSTSSASTSSGWQTAGVQQKSTQGAQRWGCQQGQAQSRSSVPQQQQRPPGQQQQRPQGQQQQRPPGQQQQRPEGQQQQQRPSGQQLQHPPAQQLQHPLAQQQQRSPAHQLQHPPAQQMQCPQAQQMQHTPHPIGQQNVKQQHFSKASPTQQAGDQPNMQRSRPVGPTPSQPAAIIKRGTIGQPGQVAVNYLDINIEKMPKIAFHYDVKIEPEKPKKFWRQAFEQFRVNQLRGAIAAFDGKASCYSVDRLNTKSYNGEVNIIDRFGHAIRYTVQIKETSDPEVDLNSLRNYMSERIFDKPMRAMQCLEVVMATPCHKKAIRFGRSFFKMSAPGQRRELEDGYEALIGLYQAFMLGDRPFLNVDISHKSFPMEMSVLEYLERYVLRQRINTSTDLSQMRGSIDSFLKGLNVIYTPPKCFDSMPRSWRINGLSRDSASKQFFELEGKVVAVADYYRARNYKLQFPELHCLNVGPPAKNIMVPIELCHIEGGQALNRKDGVTQVANMIKFAATSTNDRKAKIMDLLQFFQHNSDPTISRFGIRIASDFIVVQTRTLVPPQLEYQAKKFCSVRNGVWRMDNMLFLKPQPKVHRWAILYFDPPRGRKMPYNQVADFEEKMFGQSKTVNVSLDKRAEIRPYKDERSLDQCLMDLRGRCDLAFVIIPQFGVTYSIIKQKAELQHGILTQCIKQFTVERKLNPQVIGNILLKVNSKLNGINHKLKDDPRQPMVKKVMFLGADVSHPSPEQREIPSVVGVAASHDHFGSAYNMQYRLQRSTLEEIEDMESITMEHLRVYQKYHHEYPEHIIYYRDGVSDGQFPKIKNEELRGITAACRQIGINPKICCIIVVKRHHTRFFPNGGPTQFNKYNNVSPGTVVDRTIVHPNEVQFFMVSHQSIQGTAKPTRYNVIENTGRLDIDLLQQLTFNLCHMFPRCTRSVSYPAPAYLAHLVAARARHYLTGTDRFQDLKKEYNKRKIVAEFMNTNPMFFV